MRQRLFPLKELCKKGMEPSPDLNSTYWALLQNCRCVNGVGIGLGRLPTPILAPEVVQSFTVGSTEVHLSATKLYDSSFAELLTFAAGTRRWSCADFGMFAILSNGLSTLMCDADGVFSLVGGDGQTVVGFIPQGLGVCECNGQAVIAGYPTTNCVAWSKIGSIDFTVGIDNEAGYRDIELGNVFAVKQLGANTIAYADNGVHQMHPAGSTFGHTTLLRVPLDNECCIAGDKFEHILRDADGQLWKLQAQNSLTEKVKAPTLLDYSQYFAEVPLSMSYNSNKRECYLTYADKTYVLDQFGLSCTNLRFDSVTKFHTVTSETRTLGGPQLETDWINFGVAGLKQISEVMLGLLAGTNVKVFLRVGSNTSVEIPINSLNAVKPFITGEKFKICIKADQAAFNLNELNIQTINVDGRFGQGVAL